MDEYIDILDEGGEKTGETLTYNEVHKKGLRHRTIHVWIINSEGNLLIQKRSKYKKSYPEHWDISVAGHISAREISLGAAKREFAEELGLDLDISRCQFLFTIKMPRVVHSEAFIECEFNDVFLIDLDLNINEIKFDPEEVSELKWISLHDLMKLVREEGESIAKHDEEYKKLFEHLKRKK